jgi:hypothetical protein
MQDHASDNANGSDADLTVAAPIVNTFDDRTVEQKNRKLEGQPTLKFVPFALGVIPFKIHGPSQCVDMACPSKTYNKPRPQMIGTASALHGLMRMANGALCTLAVGFFPATPALFAVAVRLAGLPLGQ